MDNEHSGSDLEDFDCKIVLVGDSKCGKTSMTLRFIKDMFTEVYTPTGFEKYSVTYRMNGYRIHFSIWDTSGSNSYDSLRPLAYQDTKVFFLCFQLNDPVSLENAVTKWYPEILQYSENTPVIFCGCKSDLRNDSETISNLAKIKKSPVSSEQAVQASREVDATTYVETSAKTCRNGITDAFEVAALAALGKLNKNHDLFQRQSGRKMNRSGKSKMNLKSELKDKAKNCSVM